MNKKVLVTGSSGQLGLTLKDFYFSKSSNYDFVFKSKLELDILNIEAIRKIFLKNNFSYCINCAAFTNVEQAEKTPEIAFKINSEAVKKLATVCKTYNCILIHISTDYVFDGLSDRPYKEDFVTNPINVYGESKLLGEKHIQEILSNYYIIRTSWLYSKKHGENFYKRVIDKAKKGEKLVITSEQIGCPTDAFNLAKYIFKLLSNPSIKFGIKHYCDEVQMTWYDFAYEIIKENNLLDSTNLVKANNYITFAKRPKYSVLQNTKL